MPDNDDEVLQEFDRVRKHTRMDIYHDVMRDESGSKSEEDELQHKKTRISTRTRRCYYINSEDDEDFEDEVFTPEKYKEIQDKTDNVYPLIMYLWFENKCCIISQAMV